MKNWSLLKKVGFMSCYALAGIGIVGMTIIDYKMASYLLKEAFPKMINKLEERKAKRTALLSAFKN